MKHGKIGRYELLHKIAAGGMAEVFLARQWGQGDFFRDVVIKRLFQHYAEHEHALRMFQDEARLLAELSHPNIPQVYDLGYAEGFWYLAMEHVGGVTLTDLCRTAAKLQRPMPLAVAIGIVIQVCMALHHAHERRDREGKALRIVHRDVTPHNIIITLDAVVKVLDFGVAQTSARVDTDAGAVRGTYAYMGPEQVRGKHLDKRADVFALGVILYELTTGRRLFRGSDVEIMTAIVERDVTPPSRHVPNYPPELEQIVLQALSRDRAKRTASAAHMALALDQFCMRQGLVTGALVMTHYVRSIYPYERAHEKGMGIVREPGDNTPGPRAGVDNSAAQRALDSMAAALRGGGSDINAPALRGGGSDINAPALRGGGSDINAPVLRGGGSDINAPALRGGGSDINAPALRGGGSDINAPALRGGAGEASPGAAASDDLEAKLLADELRALGQSSRPRRKRPDLEVEEISAEDLLVDEEEPKPPPKPGARPPDRLGLDAFDDDSDVRPVVLLSPKRKSGDNKADGAFMSDLERRLREDPGEGAVEPEETDAGTEGRPASD